MNTTAVSICAADNAYESKRACPQDSSSAYRRCSPGTYFIDQAQNDRLVIGALESKPDQPAHGELSLAMLRKVAEISP